MNIIVCIKQVPGTTQVKINPETNTLIREGVESIINPFDENAIEAALQLKEKNGGKVTVITMGPPQAAEALRGAIALGVDEVVLVSDRAFAGSDTWATSYTLAAAIKKIGQFDLVICGKQAIDGDTAQVGPGVAEVLGLPQITFAVNVEINNGMLKVNRLLEETNEIVQTKLPAVITVVKQINTPRMPSFKGKMKAKKAEVTTWNAKDLNADENKIGQKGSPTWVVKIFTPPPKGGGEMLQGSSDEMVSTLTKKLQEKKLC
ncbi:electron transfer flavoprotein subunit beta/FixA family protein [Candidatus Margulisiibacteriota bacterium]